MFDVNRLLAQFLGNQPPRRGRGRPSAALGAVAAGDGRDCCRIYAASVMAIDPEGAAERGYLGMLASRMGLEPDLVGHIHRTVGRALG